MVTLNYGTVPTWAGFYAEFKKVMGGDVFYDVKHSVLDTMPLLPSGKYSCAQIFGEVQRLAALWNSDHERAEEAGSLAGSILESLNFEWV